MSILELLGLCLVMYNCEITNKFGAVGAVLLIISAVLQLLIRFI
jgi:hypothetical protein